jgi:N6-L-threonylcarbamoyladenine synthase
VLVLGIETSCDETAVAVVEDGVRIRSSIVHSQVARHERFGGVVPEIAAREHVRNLPAVLETALGTAGVRLEDLDLLAVTDRPGLNSALLTGIAAGEALALALDRPLVGVNHIEAHLLAPFLAQGARPDYPFLALVASGGHTHLFACTSPVDPELLGATQDDAAGEAFDKVGKLLGLPFPGGPAIDREAEGGRPDRVPFKRPLLDRDSLDFSFSGLKTAVLHLGFVRGPDGRPERELRADLSVADLAASFQEAVVDVLVEKVGRAVQRTGIQRVSVGGGVACNRRLRAALAARAAREGWELLLAPPALCADNAAMVAARGEELWRCLGPEAGAPRASPRATWKRRSPPVVDRPEGHG